MPSRNKRQKIDAAPAKASDDEADGEDQSDREEWASLANKYIEGDLKIGDSISVEAQDMICPNVQIVAIEGGDREVTKQRKRHVAAQARVHIA